MVEEKLPKEIAAKKLELQIYEDVINERVINSQYLGNLQNRIDKVAQEIKQITESRVIERDTDNLLPFRQQAATVNRIKDTAAEQLDDLTKSIRELDANIARKQTVLQQRIGETYLRGDDLKQYVNMLKAKSSVYKKQRAELSALEVNCVNRDLALVSFKITFCFCFQIERNDLESTLEKLKAQYPTLYIPADKLDGGGGGNETNGLPDDVKPLSEASSVMEVSRLVTHLTRAVASARERVSALMQELHPLKEKMVLLNDECDEKKKVCELFSLHLGMNEFYMYFSVAVVLVHIVRHTLDRRTMHCKPH